MTFDGRLLSGVSVLAAVVESGSFVKAADVVGLSASGVSRAVSRLEQRLGIRLFDRTTRTQRLTDEGQRFYAQVSPLLDGIEEAAVAASGASTTVGGRLRVNVDRYFSRLILAPKLKEFVGQYPNLQLELFTRDEMGDLIADGVDVALRFGPQRSSSMIARLLLETRILTVASPSYIAERGAPRTPQDLDAHECILFRDPTTGTPFEWELQRGKEVVPINAKGALLLTDVATMLEACVSGAGIAQVMALGIRDQLEQGRLVDLFPDWPGETFPLYVIHPSRNHPPAKVRAFIDFCVEKTR
jgi:DNA-binding transcriptional LysR family regulator